MKNCKAMSGYQTLVAMSLNGAGMVGEMPGNVKGRIKKKPGRNQASKRSGCDPY